MPDFESIASKFVFEGVFSGVEPLGNGLINDSYVVRCGEYRYVLQRVNRAVFQEPEKVMENIERVLSHARAYMKAGGMSDIERRCLRLIEARSGGVLSRDEEGDYWRAYAFVEGASTHDSVSEPWLAREAASAYGLFQKMLSGMDCDSLHDTIPGFHDTPSRYRNLCEAIDDDVCNRAKEVKEEIAFASEREELMSLVTSAMASGKVPTRVTHNDTKLNNVLIDDHGRKGLCVIDLDTVMAGSALYDFGDLVRSAVNPAAEDERQLDEVCVRLDVFEALAEGYLGEVGGMLTESEKELLPVSGLLITLETGMRFLTDYLQGDVYFKTRREGHNLDRCRAQFKLAASLAENMNRMRSAVNLIL